MPTTRLLRLGAAALAFSVIPALGAVSLVVAPPGTSPATGPGEGRSAAVCARVPCHRPPLEGEMHVLRGFEAPARRWSPGHRGVDLSAEAGSAVLATAGGVVTVAGTVVDRGVLVIEHADGLRSTLEPVIPLVGVGTLVTAGQTVARLAADHAGHCPARPCLHWGVRRADDDYLDPLVLLADTRDPIVLLGHGRPEQHLGGLRGFRSPSAWRAA